MRFLVEHPDARSTRAFEEVLTQPAPDDRVGSLVTEQAKLGRQGLVRIGTPESVGMVARYIEQMRQRPFAYDPCHERRCGAADRDGDGWPDDAEERLGTSPDNADSDGDGLPDPRDRCPLQKSSSAPMSEDDRAWQAALVALSVPWGVGPLEVSSDTLCFEGATVPLLHVPAAWWTSNRIRT